MVTVFSAPNYCGDFDNAGKKYNDKYDINFKNNAHNNHK
jgi:hypothetical protein